MNLSSLQGRHTRACTFSNIIHNQAVAPLNQRPKSIYVHRKTFPVWAVLDFNTNI